MLKNNDIIAMLFGRGEEGEIEFSVRLFFLGGGAMYLGNIFDKHCCS